MEDRAAGDVPMARRLPVVGCFVLAGVAFGALFPLVSWILRARAEIK